MTRVSYDNRIKIRPSHEENKKTEWNMTYSHTHTHTHQPIFSLSDIILVIKLIQFLVRIFHKACVCPDPSSQRKKKRRKKITPQRNTCTQALSGRIHWHSAMVPNLIWKQVASGWVSKFESFIKVIQMEISGHECPELNSIWSNRDAFGLLRRCCCYKKRIVYNLWTTL